MAVEGEVILINGKYRDYLVLKRKQNLLKSYIMATKEEIIEINFPKDETQVNTKLK